MVGNSRFVVQFLLSLLIAGLTGCTFRVAIPSGANPTQTSGSITLYRHPMEIRLAKPAKMPPTPILIIYATGDGGWSGVDEKVFYWIAESGRPIAGFSSKNYLKNLGYVSGTDTTTPRRLVRDYRQMIAFALKGLDLPADTPILFVGNSRGAGLSVVAAAQGDLKPHLAGLIGIALTGEEEHVLHYRQRRNRTTFPMPPREMVEIKTYEYLPRLSTFPVCVIQSTNDNYLPAKAARRLFGPDGDLRRFRSISARNHRFSGGREELHDEILAAINWIAEAESRRPDPKTQTAKNP